MGIFAKKSFSGGIHPPENKSTENSPIRICPAPDQVIIPLQQHIGAPSKPIVEKGSEVKIGDPISEAAGFVCVPSHASVSGKVKAVDLRPHPLGKKVMSVVIDNDGKDTWSDNVAPQEDYLSLDKKELVNRISAAGIAGMGGATFPTHVKLSPPPDKKIDTLILNGVECEPYLTSDHRLMLEEPDKIIKGMQITMHILGAEKGAIGIESNKPDAIKLLRDKVKQENLPYEVISLHVKYPQGAEKQLIKAVVNREVPSGGLPMDVGCVVQNVGTVAAVYDAVVLNRPIVDRVVTVTGRGINAPQNLLVRIGTPYSHVIEQCGGLKDSAGKMILGGPMMGLAQSDFEAPVIKGTSGLLFLDEKEAKRKQSSHCISCARCVDVCPMGLMPKNLAQFSKHEKVAELDDYNVLDCIECGSCSYVCPAHLNLLHLLRFGKMQVIQSKKKNQ